MKKIYLSEEFDRMSIDLYDLHGWEDEAYFHEERSLFGPEWFTDAINHLSRTLYRV